REKTPKNWRGVTKPAFFLPTDFLSRFLACFAGDLVFIGPTGEGRPRSHAVWPESVPSPSDRMPTLAPAATAPRHLGGHPFLRWLHLCPRARPHCLNLSPVPSRSPPALGRSCSVSDKDQHAAGRDPYRRVLARSDGCNLPPPFPSRLRSGRCIAWRCSR